MLYLDSETGGPRVNTTSPLSIQDIKLVTRYPLDTIVDFLSQEMLHIQRYVLHRACRKRIMHAFYEAPAPASVTPAVYTPSRQISIIFCHSEGVLLHFLSYIFYRRALE